MNVFTLSGEHTVELVAFLLKLKLSDTSKHLGEVPLHLSDILGVSNNLEQVLVSDKVETGETLPLLFQIVTEGFLNLAEHIGESL